MSKSYPEYKAAQNPKNGKWYVVGYIGGKGSKYNYMPVSNPFDSKKAAEAHIPHMLQADAAAKRELMGWNGK